MILIDKCDRNKHTRVTQSISLCGRIHSCPSDTSIFLRRVTVYFRKSNMSWKTWSSSTIGYWLCRTTTSV
jgi:hypothetical protein